MQNTQALVTGGTGFLQSTVQRGTRKLPFQAEGHQEGEDEYFGSFWVQLFPAPPLSYPGLVIVNMCLLSFLAISQRCNGGREHPSAMCGQNWRSQAGEPRLWACSAI
ncbi:Hypothetical predicted protein [Podarcis lilfordi]|uniref:Uncharacterized protein n=1 Tax=Podarcis lilfordi TaxID=74358 RepID=A0AA35LJ63_9SAUR|nr:Hypothetical predicted protein [Podarcis lilfordi]